MTVELAANVEEQLRGLASKQGRNIGVLVEEAIRRYLEAAAITDLAPAEVAEAQVALMGELGAPHCGQLPKLSSSLRPAETSEASRQGTQ